MSAPCSKLTREDAQAIFDLAEAWVDQALTAERAFFQEAKEAFGAAAAEKRAALRLMLVKLAEGDAPKIGGRS